MTSPLLPERRPEFELAEPVAEEAPQASGFRAQRFLTFLLKYWWVPVVTLTLSMAGALVYQRWVPRSYVSSARMWETEKIRLPEGTLFSEDMQTFLGTQTELLQSGKLRAMVLERLNAGGSNAVALGQNGKALPVKIAVTPSAKSSIFTLEATSSDAAYATRYLDVLMEVYLGYKKDLRQELSGGALASILQEQDKREKELKTQQDNLTMFQRTKNLAILQEEGTIAGGYLARLKNELTDLELEDRLLNEGGIGANNGDLKAMDAQRNAGSPSPANAHAEEQAAMRDIELLKIQREELGKTLRPKHPRIVKLDADIEHGEKLLEIFRRQSGEDLAALRQATKLKIVDTQALIRQTEAKVEEAEASIAEAERLKLIVQRAQSKFDQIEALVQNIGISRNIEPESISILESASPAKRSYKEESMLLGMGAMGGLCLGLGIVLVITIRDDRFTSVVEISERYGDAIVGQVPEVSGARRDSSLPLLKMDDDRHIYVEAFRSLRSALFFGAVDGEKLRVLLITSAVPNEGKSTIAANLARTLALGGSRVVLVDADVRRGMLHKLMGKQRGPGLAELLRQEADMESVIQKDTMPNLSFVSRGSILNNPGDFFLGPIFDQFLVRLRERFDYVLIDTCPVFAADDATTLAPKVDGTLVVVRSGFSSAHAVQRALELLSQRKAKVLGLIFNRANASARTYYYYTYEEYHKST